MQYDSVLSIDIETFSKKNIKTAGGYTYAANSQIIIFAWAFDNEKVNAVDLLSGERIPARVIAALTNPRIKKKAFNANFERNCLCKHLGIYLPPEQWECTMIRCAMLGLPLNLEDAAKVLKVKNQKDKLGKSLIKFFCEPCVPTKTKPGHFRNLPKHDQVKWSQFISYCITDVEAERDISDALSFYHISDFEHDLWCLDQRINERGFKIDEVFVNEAIKLDLAFRDRLIKEAKELTGLTNPNSVAQLKTWLSEATGDEVITLNKESLKDLLGSVDDKIARRVIEIRQDLSKTSVKKFNAMLAALGVNNRLYGLTQHYAANRTGRWGGRIVQPHNLPRGNYKDVTLPRSLVSKGRADILEILYGAIPNVLSSLIRSAFVSENGKDLYISDFSAIEARIISWLSGEEWRLEVFRTHGKIYEASASKMFKTPLNEITKDSPLRQRGKVSELALGYQGGVNALLRMDTDKSLNESELPGLVKAWRRENPKIVELWRDVNKAAIKAISEGGTVPFKYNMSFEFKKGFLFITLPSGRKLSYANASLAEGKFGYKVTYSGIDQTSKKWCRMDTYGGKLVENIVQAIARDCLAYALVNVDRAGFNIVMHVHDEIVTEDSDKSIEDLDRIMGQVPPWAPGLPLGAEGFVSKYYKK